MSQVWDFNVYIRMTFMFDFRETSSGENGRKRFQYVLTFESRVRISKSVVLTEHWENHSKQAEIERNRILGLSSLSQRSLDKKTIDVNFVLICHLTKEYLSFLLFLVLRFLISFVTLTKEEYLTFCCFLCFDFWSQTVPNEQVLCCNVRVACWCL